MECLYCNFAFYFLCVVFFFFSDLYSSPCKAFTVFGDGVNRLLACIDYFFLNEVPCSMKQGTADLNFPLRFHSWRECLEMTISIGMSVSF